MNLPVGGKVYSWTVSELDFTEDFDEAVDAAIEDINRQGHRVLSVTFATSQEEKLIVTEDHPLEDQAKDVVRWCKLTRYTAFLLCHNPVYQPPA